MIGRRAFLSGLGATAALAGLPAPLAAAPLAKVRELGVLRAVVYRDNAPWSSEVGGKVAGIDADLAAACAEQLGVRLDLAQITADESVSDDLRNAVWRGGLLGFQPGDVMLHVPFDPRFAAENDQVAIAAPYFRETFAIACNGDGVDCEAAPVSWKGRALAAELDSIPDFYLTGSFGGQLAPHVRHYMSGAAAVDAVAKGESEVVVATRAQVESAVHKGARLKVRKGHIPLVPSTGWDIGVAVKDNSRTLSDAIEDIVVAMSADGRMAALFARHGVTWQPASAA